jgi:two-component system osmolarity sensor histidine kinase EnvZ
MAAAKGRRRSGLMRHWRSAVPRSTSLFWRTFALLNALLLVCIAAWLQAFISLEIEPRAVQSAQQLASLVNLSRASLRTSDAIGRVLLIKTLAEQEGLSISPRRSSDRYIPRRASWLQESIHEQLRRQIGPSTVLAASVNGQTGLWIGFDIEEDAYWLRTDEARLAPTRAGTWLLWLLTAALLSLLGSAVIARVINRPLRELARASTRLREHAPGGLQLDERARTTEIRQVNIAFNRMSEQLAKLEHERALLLAGISHDLRTPLARLRLEAEMSVPKARARAHMVADVEQMDAIIDKFLAHSSPQPEPLKALPLLPLAQQACFALADDPQTNITMQIQADLQVLADPVELMRVLSNLLENARRYGRSSDGISRIDLQASASQAWVLLTVSDHGAGVPQEQLTQLTRPYFRGEKADAGGSGLGLAIVESSVLRMGGGFSLSLLERGGLCASVRLRRG